MRNEASHADVLVLLQRLLHAVVTKVLARFARYQHQRQSYTAQFI